MTEAEDDFFRWAFDKPNIAQILKAWRGTASQAVAADTLGVSLRTYSHWEQGRNPDPSTLALLLRLIKLVKAVRDPKTKDEC